VDLLNIIMIGIGLSMDALAVSISSGITIKKLQVRHAFKIALFFGVFQAIMPIIGWFAGFTFRSYIMNFDHWIAFILLSFIGGKMVYESRIMICEEQKNDPLKLIVLFGLAIATSIDALAVGVTFAFLNVMILMPALIIGLITFSISLGGVFLGKKLGCLFEKKVELAGGLILIGIGIKILVEHLLTK